VLRTLDYRYAGFTDLKQTAITQLGYGTNSKLKLQFDLRFWQQRGPWPGNSTGDIFTNLRLQSAWDEALAQPGRAGLIVDYTGGPIGAAYQPAGPYTTSDSPAVRQYAQAFPQQLETIWPGVSQHYNGRAALSYPTGDPNLRGSYSCWLVGQYTLFAGYERVRQGRIHFAGEHTSTDFQGYMEGGAESGARAAREVIRRLAALDVAAQFTTRASVARE
jgi:monoamine oxidase